VKNGIRMYIDIVECFDIDEKIMVDTSGYEYPRYKAAIT
jgi:hypothetical protein